MGERDIREFLIGLGWGLIKRKLCCIVWNRSKETRIGSNTYLVSVLFYNTNRVAGFKLGGFASALDDSSTCLETQYTG